MKSSRLYIIATLTLLALAGVLGRVVAEPTSPTAVAETVGATAVCDMNQVIIRFADQVELKAGLKDMAQDLDKQRIQRERELEDLKAQLKELKSGSAAFMERLETLEVKTAELKVWKEAQQTRMRNRQMRAIMQVRSIIIQAIGRVGVERGFAVVLSKTNPNAPVSSPEQLGAPRVLYCNDAVDITEEVIGRLTTQFGAETN